MSGKRLREAVCVAKQETAEAVKERRKAGVCRFLNDSRNAQKRRADRQRMRKARRNKKARARNSRAKPPAAEGRHGFRAGALPCCGRRPARCTCWCAKAPKKNKAVVALCDRDLVQKAVRRINNANILTFRDTADMPHFLSQCPGNPAQPMHYRWGIAMLWRCFSNFRFWKVVIASGAIQPAREPNWQLFEAALRAYERENLASHGGMFYTTMLTHYRLDVHSPFIAVTKMDSCHREVCAYRAMWAALPRQELALFRAAPTRDTFKSAVTKFQTQLYGTEKLTKGKFNDYAVKCMLDALIINGTVSPRVLSTWPMKCPAYRKQLRILYPGLKPSEYFIAGCHWHYMIYKRHRFHIADSLAQLCWIERRQH